jgi:ABC-type nitrate/sulfonate/bicarbonate transport system permease component
VKASGLPAPLRALVFPAVLVLALEAWARTAGRGSDAVAAPSAAALALARAAADGSLLQGTAFTLGCAATGLAVGALLGTLLGTWLGLVRCAAAAAFGSVELLRPIPSVALIPLAMLIFGFGVGMEAAVIAFATFWPMLVLAQAAARQVDPQLLEVARALQLSPRRRFVSVLLPAMVPRLFVALRLCTAIALVVAVTVEIAANPHGMGYALIIAQQSLDPALMLAWLLWIGAVGYAINALTLGLERRVARQMGQVAA